MDKYRAMLNLKGRRMRIKEFWPTEAFDTLYQKRSIDLFPIQISCYFFCAIDLQICWANQSTPSLSRSRAVIFVANHKMPEEEYRAIFCLNGNGSKKFDRTLMAAKKSIDRKFLRMETRLKGQTFSLVTILHIFHTKTQFWQVPFVLCTVPTCKDGHFIVHWRRVSVV